MGRFHSFMAMAMMAVVIPMIILNRAAKGGECRLVWKSGPGRGRLGCYIGGVTVVGWDHLGATVSCFFLQVDFSFIFEKVFISTSVSGWEGCAALQIEPFGWRWSSSLSWSRWEMKIQFEFWCHYSYNRGGGEEEEKKEEEEEERYKELIKKMENDRDWCQMCTLSTNNFW